MANIISILSFFFITWSFGYTTLRLLKATQENHPIVELLARFAIGTAVFSLLGVVLKILHIPLHITVYLGLAVAYPTYVLLRSIIKNEPVINDWKIKPFWREQITYILILLGIMMMFTFMMFHKGAFGYPYLENDDPWAHAQGSTYVARMMTYDVDPAVREIQGLYSFYLEPYPPTYDVMMGVLRQTNDSIVWTLKFFNVLLITMGIAFAFLFFRTYLQNDIKGILATFVLVAVPSYMSHFIWSQTIAVILVPVAFYAILRGIEDKTWRVPAMIAIGSQLVTQPVVSMIFGVSVLVLVACIALHEAVAKRGPAKKRFTQTISAFIIGAGGVAFSLLFWGAQVFKWGIDGIFGTKGGEFSGGWASAYAMQQYRFAEVFFPPSSSRIDQAIGWGPVITLLAAITIIIFLVLWTRSTGIKKDWRYVHMMIWFLALCYIVFAPSFGLPSWGTSRMWVSLAIPLAAVCATGAYILARSIAGKNGLLTLAIIAILAVGIGMTSLPAKIAVQTAQWPPGVQWTPIQAENGQIQYPDLQGLLAMSSLIPKNSRVFSFCGSDSRSIGFDMQADPWDLGHAKFRQTVINATSDEISAFLMEYKYEYMTLDLSCSRDFGENATNTLASRLTEMGRFQMIHQQPGFVLARIA